MVVRKTKDAQCTQMQIFQFILFRFFCYLDVVGAAMLVFYLRIECDNVWGSYKYETENCFTFLYEWRSELLRNHSY